MNLQYHFDSAYMVCVAENMESVAPFGDVPKKMTATIKRSMAAVRALEKSLKTAFQTLEDMKKVSGSMRRKET